MDTSNLTVREEGRILIEKRVGMKEQKQMGNGRKGGKRGGERQ